MKKSTSYIAVALLAALALPGCNDNFELPPMVYPTFDWTANTTIAELKTQYWSTDRNYVNTIGLNADGEHIYIKGRVISENESGNIYNSIVIQDETGALNIAVRTNYLEESYLFGQEVVIDVTELNIGGYNSLMQLGAEGTYNGSPSMTFMEATTFESHAELNGAPSASLCDTIIGDIAEIMSAKANKEGLIKWQSQLVRFDNVTFEDPGQVYAGSSSTDRYVTDANGNRLNVRTSSYASFKNELIPSGSGSVVGILSYYGSDWQLLLNDITGVIGFTPYDPSAEPDVPANTEAVSSVEQNFDASTSIPDGWSQVQVSGDKSWYVTTFNSNNYIAMTGYKGTNPPFDQWLLTPPVDMSKATDKVLSFRTQFAPYSSTTTVFEVYVLDNADPSKATVKDKLSPALPTSASSTYSDWVESGELDLSKYSGTIYVAFRYYATSADNYATWCVDNVKVNVK